MVLFISCLAWLTCPLLFKIFKRKAVGMKDDEHIRGARLIDVHALRKEINAVVGPKGILSFGQILLPDEIETRHIFIAGQTGSGKSTTGFNHLCAILDNGRRCVAHDFKGELISNFYRPGKDLIFNPIDARGLGWTLLNEVESRIDFNAIVGSLIPSPASGDERYWVTAAQELARGVLAACYKSGDRSNADLWRYLTMPARELGDFVRTTSLGDAGYTHIQDPGSKQATSVIAVMISYLSWLEYTIDGPFSTRRWISSSDENIIYLSGHQDVMTTIEPAIGLFIDLMGKRLLSAPDTKDPKRSVHFFLDEFGNMQKLPTIKRLATAGRSKRAILEILVQELAAVESIYGKEDSRTILNNCATKFVMSLGDPDSMEYFSRLVGKQDYWQASTTFTTGTDESKGGENHQRRVQSRDAILSSDIRKLKIGQGYLITPSNDPALISITNGCSGRNQPMHPAFLQRNGLDLDELRSKAELIAARAKQVKESEVPQELKDAVEKNAMSSLNVSDYDIDI